MTQIAILSKDEKLNDMLRPSGLRSKTIDLNDLTAFTSAPEAPQVLVIDMRGRDQLPQALAAFRRQHPGAGVVLVVSSLDARLMLEAMRSGVSECVSEPIAPKALEEAVRRVLTSGAPEPVGRVLAFVGAKGGVGTSTLAVNTAAALSSASNEVLLIDLHITHGDAAVFLGVEPRFSVLDALENIQRIDESFFAGIVEKTPVGIQLLASSTRSAHTPIDGKRVRALVDAAAKMYRTTVLDVPRADTTTLDSLDAASTIIITTSQEIAALRSTATLAEMLRRRYGAPRVKVVINRYLRDGVIAHADVERVVGGSVKHMIPSDYRSAVDALNAGRPAVLETSRLASSLRTFAQDLTGLDKEPAERRPGMLSRLAFRRA